MDYGDYYIGTTIGDPCPHSLLSTKQKGREIRAEPLIQSLGLGVRCKL